MNTIQEDIAQALTGSLPTDGSAAMTGALNLNGQNLNGVNALSMNGPLNAPSATISVLNATNFQAPVYNSSVNFVGNNISNVGTMNVIGNFTANGIYGNGIFSSGDVDASGNVNGGGLYGGYVHSTGDVSADNDLTASGIVSTGFGANFNGDVQMNAHWLQSLRGINAVGGDNVHIGNGGLSVDGGNTFSSGTVQCPNLVTTNGVGSHQWAFGINGGYGYAQADGGAIFLWGTSDARYKTNVQPILQAGAGLGLIRTVQPFSFDMKMTPEDSGRHADIGLIADHMPLAFRSEAAGVYGIDVYAMLAALCQAVTELATQVEALEARLAA